MRFRKLLAALMVASMVLGLIGSAAFAQGSDQALFDEAVEMLREFKIVQGDAGTGDLRPNDSITRAEMIKVLVTAAGQGEVAALLAGAPAFSDSQNHWASGFIALAKNMGLTTGYPDGTFRPDAEVTYAEVVALLTRLVGVQPAAGTWPTNYIQAANDAGINVADMDLTGLANASAVRGAVFVLSHSAFMNVQDSSGKNLYQKSFDSTPPTITVDAVSSPTEAASVTVSGKAADATAAFVGGSAVELAADGSFSADVELKLGANEIVVTAIDAVGNEGSATVAIERLNAPASAIEADASLEVVAGESAEVSATVKDQNGAAIEGAEVTGAVSPEGLGTFAAGTFTAGAATGTGTLTLSYGDVSAEVAVTVTAGALASISVTPSKSVAAPGELVTMTVKGADANGNEVNVSPTFSVDGTDALINPSNGNFIASKAGSYTITATSGDVSGTATVGIYGDVASLKVEGAAEVIGNDKTDITLTISALDANGNAVAKDGQVEVTTLDGGLQLDDNKVAQGQFVKLTAGKATIKLQGLNNNVGQVRSVKFTWDANDDGAIGATETITATHKVEIIDQVASSIKIGGDKFIAANAAQNEAKVTATVLDQAGETMLTGAWDVAWEISGPAVQKTTEKTSGTTTTTAQKLDMELWSKLGQTGNVTVTFTIDGVGSATATVTAAVAGSAAKLSLAVSEAEITASAYAETTKLTITITDANGVPVEAGSARTIQVEFANKDLQFDAAKNGQNAEAVGGNANATNSNVVDVAFGANDTKKEVTIGTWKAGNQSFTVKDKDGKLSSTTGSFSVKPGTSNRVGFTRKNAESVVVPVSNPTGTLTLQVYDEWGNKTTASNVEFTITAYSDAAGNTTTEEITLNGTKKEIKVKTDANGSATINFETRPYTGIDYTIGISKVATNYQTRGNNNLIPILVLANPPAKVAVALKTTNNTGTAADVTSVTAGTMIWAWVTFEDAFGAKIDGNAGDAIRNVTTIEITEGEWDAGGDVGTDTDRDTDALTTKFRAQNAGDKAYKLEAAPIKDGRVNITVKVNLGDSSLSAATSVRVRTGDPTKVTVAEADKNGIVKLDASTVKAYTLRLVDEWSNMVTSDLTYYVGVDYGAYTDGSVSVRTSTDGASVSHRTAPAAANAYAAADLMSIRSTRTIYVISTTLSTGDPGVDITFWASRDVGSDGNVDSAGNLTSSTLKLRKP